MKNTIILLRELLSEIIGFVHFLLITLVLAITWWFGWGLLHHVTVYQLELHAPIADKVGAIAVIAILAGIPMLFVSAWWGEEMQRFFRTFRFKSLPEE
jgi:hypothetical protein